MANGIGQKSLWVREHTIAREDRVREQGRKAHTLIPHAVDARADVLAEGCGPAGGGG